MYDRDAAGVHLRPHLVPMLGLWHPLVHAQLCIWRSASSWLFGPLFHILYPTSKFNIKPTHKFLTWFLSMVRLIWPEIRPLVAEAYASAAMDLTSMTLLNNLVTVSTYFIPKVTLSSLTHLF